MRTRVWVALVCAALPRCLTLHAGSDPQPSFRASASPSGVLEAAEVTVTVTGAATSSTPLLGRQDRSFRPEGWTRRLRDIVFLPDGRVLLAGMMSAEPNGPELGVLRLLSDGTLDPTFRFHFAGLLELHALDRQPDGRLVAYVRSTGGYGVRRVLEDGSADPTFPDVGVAGGVDVQVAPDGGILVIGTEGITRLHPNGDPDTAFRSRARLDGGAFSMSLDSTGRIYLGGTFTRVADQPRPQLVRLLPDGSLDADFQPTRTLRSPPEVLAHTDGVLVLDVEGIHRHDATGQSDRTFVGRLSPSAWALDRFGGILAVATPAGTGMWLRPDGRVASPGGTFSVSGTLITSGYAFLRVGPDGALWLALGSSGGLNPIGALLNKYLGPDPLRAWSNGHNLADAAAQPGADPDGDGANNLAEFAYGTSPRAATHRPTFETTTRIVQGVSFPEVTFLLRHPLGSLTFEAEAATSPLFADVIPVETVAVTPLGNEFNRVVIRDPRSADAGVARFFRFRVGTSPW